jgi:hypothetical protein
MMRVHSEREREETPSIPNDGTLLVLLNKLDADLGDTTTGSGAAENLGHTGQGNGDLIGFSDGRRLRARTTIEQSVSAWKTTQQQSGRTKTERSARERERREGTHDMPSTANTSTRSLAALPTPQEGGGNEPAHSTHRATTAHLPLFSGSCVNTRWLEMGVEEGGFQANTTSSNGKKVERDSRRKKKRNITKCPHFGDIRIF